MTYFRLPLLARFFEFLGPSQDFFQNRQGRIAQFFDSLHLHQLHLLPINEVSGRWVSFILKQVPGMVILSFSYALAQEKRKEGFFMKISVSSALLLTCVTLLMGFGAGLQDTGLDQFKWKNRIILLASSSASDQELVQQLGILSGKDDALSDRDLIIIQLLLKSPSSIEGETLGQESAKKIRSRFQIPREGFEILLIGKDGTVKLRSDKPVSSDYLFALIDSMPMRKREMRNN